MVKKSSDQPSQRQMRVAEAVKRSILQMITFGKIAPDVQLSADLRSAKIYVEKPLFNKSEISLSESQKRAFVKNLQKYTVLIRTLLAKEIQMKYAPNVFFYYDDRIEHAHRVDHILNSLSETSES
jgi:ribosome-binding factor A